MDTSNLILMFFFYAFAGWILEVSFSAVKKKEFINRGFLNGPVCPIYGFSVMGVYLVLGGLKDRPVLLYLASSLLITFIEGITGFLMEKFFHHKWWDYSHLPLNIGGYVAIHFSMIWGFFALVIIKFINPLLIKLISFLPNFLTVSLSVVFLLVFLADIVVTLRDILSINRKLRIMERVTADLLDISDKLGENVYDHLEEGKYKYMERKRRYQRDKKRYQNFLDNRSKAFSRLMKAFPRLKSKRFDIIIDDLKRREEQDEKERKNKA